MESVLVDEFCKRFQQRSSNESGEQPFFLLGHCHLRWHAEPLAALAARVPARPDPGGPRAAEPSMAPGAEPCTTSLPEPRAK